MTVYFDEDQRQSARWRVGSFVASAVLALGGSGLILLNHGVNIILLAPLIFALIFAMNGVVWNFQRLHIQVDNSSIRLQLRSLPTGLDDAFPLANIARAETGRFRTVAMWGGIGAARYPAMSSRNRIYTLRQAPNVKVTMQDGSTIAIRSMTPERLAAAIDQARKAA